MMNKKSSARRLFPATLLALTACANDGTGTGNAIQYPEADSSEAMLMIEKCSGCHLAPQPDLYSADQWPFVVHRMRLRMQTKGVVSMSDAEELQIIDYLKKHGRIK